MKHTEFEQEQLIARARIWVGKDRCDPHRQLLLDAALDLDTQEAWDELELEMARNP